MEKLSESMICEEEEDDAKVALRGGMITQETTQIKQEPEQESLTSDDLSFKCHKKSQQSLLRKGPLIPHTHVPKETCGHKEGYRQMQVKQEWTIKEELDSDMINNKDERQDGAVKEEGNSEFTDEEGDIEFIDEEGVGEVPPGFKIERQAEKEPFSHADTITSAPTLTHQPAPSKEVSKGNLRVLSADEERQLLQKLECQQESGSLPLHLQHLLQILSVRCGKSIQTNLPLSQSQYKHGMCAITSPVTRNEKECLIKIVKEFQGLIDDYSTVAVFRKAAVWQDIAARFNTATGNRKSSQQVRKIWERIRSRARKDYIRMKLQQRRTREGPLPTLLDPLSSQVLPLIRKELEPIDKAWDRDTDLRVEALLQESDANNSSLTCTSTTLEPLPCYDGTLTEPEKIQQGSSTRSHEPAVCNMSPSLKVFGSGASGFLLIPNVGSTPHQPKTAAFPKRVFGKANPVARSFQPSWFHRWPWIHYDEVNDKAFCHVCVKAYTQNLISAVVVEPLFISRGFTNWKDVTTKRGFPAHERSDCHREAVERLFNLPSKKQDVKEHLLTEHEEEKAFNRKNLLKILSNIQFLARQGHITQRDYDDSNSTLIQLCRLRAEDDPQLMTWIMTKGDTYTSAEFQNEMVEVMGRRVLKEVSTCLNNADFFSIVVDKTSDLSDEVQLVVCIRWVDDNLEVHEEFIGLYKLEKIDASSVTALIKNGLLQMNLSVQNARGHCYSGCYFLEEKRTVTTQIKQCEPRCLYCDCFDNLCLTCVDLIKNIRVIKDAVKTTYEIKKLIEKFPNCDERLEKIKKIMNEEKLKCLGIHVLSPNQWTVGAKSVNSIIENYASLKELWIWAQSHCSDPELKESIHNIHANMKNFEIFWGLVLAECILQHVYSLNASFKNQNLSAAEGQFVAAATVTSLSNLQTESEFEQFWIDVVKKAKENEIDCHEVPHQLKEQGTSKYPEMPKDMYKDIYLEAIGLIISCIQDHFDQDYKMYINCEQLLLKAACGRDFTSEFQTVTNFYSSDFVPQELQTQLNTFTHTMSTEVNVLLSDVLMHLQSLSLSQQQEISQVVKLTKLILVMPVTKSANEHLYSMLRHVRTCLQITRIENRINHLMALYVHKERITGLNLVDVANEFVSQSEHRLGVFGTFSSSDYAKNKVLVKEKSTQYSCPEMH